MQNKLSTKSLVKRILLVDLVIIVTVLAIGAIFIVPNCTIDCEARGERLGQGLAQLIIAIDIALVSWHYLKNRKKT